MINLTGFGQYIIRIEHKYPDDCHVTLEVFQIRHEVTCEKGVVLDPPRKEFQLRGKSGIDEITTELNEASRVLEGSIKWDGCSNLDFYPDEEPMYHFCGKGDLTRYTDMLAKVYDLAREAMGDKVCDIELYND